MFDLTIKIGDIVLLVQTLAIMVGFYFSVRTMKDTKSAIRIASDNLKIASDNLKMAGESLREDTANNQAQLYNQMVIQGRDLIYKHIEVYLSGQDNKTKEEREKLYTSTVISYYSACFELRSILVLPASVTKLLDAELSGLMRQSAVKTRYDTIKWNYSREFNAYVDDLTTNVGV